VRGHFEGVGDVHVATAINQIGQNVQGLVSYLIQSRAAQYIDDILLYDVHGHS
jgi:hypothetical protein